MVPTFFARIGRATLLRQAFASRAVTPMHVTNEIRRWCSRDADVAPINHPSEFAKNVPLTRDQAKRALALQRSWHG